MADRPIIFTSEMVRAIMTCAKCGHLSVLPVCPKCGSTEFLKTQTRRVIKTQPIYFSGHNEADLHIAPFWSWHKGKYGYDDSQKDWPNCLIKHCPYGVVGDRLWVREAWQAGLEWDEEKASQVDPLCGGYDVNYVADGKKSKDVGYGRVRPSIHMPKWATRIWLEITGRRVERVQDISEEDAKAEGVKPFPQSEGLNRPTTFDDYKGAFHFLWDSLNAKRGYSWESNLLVWAIEFRKVKDVL